MPKLTLTFDLPDDNVESMQAIQGWRWEMVVWEIDQWLRQIERYGEDSKKAEFAENTRHQIREIMDGLEFSG